MQGLVQGKARFGANRSQNQGPGRDRTGSQLGRCWVKDGVGSDRFEVRFSEEQDRSRTREDPVEDRPRQT